MSDLSTDLQYQGYAVRPVYGPPSKGVREARTELIAAAQASNVRIAMKRARGVDRDTVLAYVLTDEAEQASIERDELFRAVNDMREILRDLTLNDEDRDDLEDIAATFEAHARTLVENATEV